MASIVEAAVEASISRRVSFEFMAELLVVAGEGVAVGTALTGGPPHGSVRAELPHTALTLGIWRRNGHLGPDSRTHCSPIVAPIRHCVRGAADDKVFPLVGRLPSTASADGLSPSLFGGFLGTMQPSDFP